MKSAALGASVAALAVSIGSLLAPQAASALDFNFSFGGVEGLITGLVDDTANQVAGVNVEVLNNGATSAPLGIYTYTNGTGFNVSSGAVGVADWGGIFGPGVGGGILSFVPSNNVSEFIIGYLYTGVGVSDFPEVGNVTFIARQPPASSVPGPLPLFGAAAAFGFSRKLRNRIKVTRTTAPTRAAG